MCSKFILIAAICIDILIMQGEVLNVHHIVLIMNVRGWMSTINILIMHVWYWMSTIIVVIHCDYLAASSPRWPSLQWRPTTLKRLRAITSSQHHCVTYKDIWKTPCIAVILCFQRKYNKHPFKTATTFTGWNGLFSGKIQHNNCLTLANTSWLVTVFLLCISSWPQKLTDDTEIDWETDRNS